MDDFTFRLAYGAFFAVLVCVPTILLLRGLDRKRYFRPVLYGFFFGFGCWFMFGMGIFTFILGGVLTGYLLAREVNGWSKHFRAGALNSVLLNVALFMPSSFMLIGNGVYGVFTNNISYTLNALSNNVGRAVGDGEFLGALCQNVLLYTLILIAIVGLGAVLGGFVRKALKPAEPKSAQ